MFLCTASPGETALDDRLAGGGGGGSTFIPTCNGVGTASAGGAFTLTGSRGEGGGTGPGPGVFAGGFGKTLLGRGELGRDVWGDGGWFGHMNMDESRGACPGGGPGIVCGFGGGAIVVCLLPSVPGNALNWAVFGVAARALFGGVGACAI